MIGKSVLVVTPHPDDETLGCGGTLLLLRDRGYSLNWLIITEITEEHGFSEEKIQNRSKEIEIVSKIYKFDKKVSLRLPTSKVDEISKGDLVGKISNAFNDIRPNTLFVPFKGDIHTDHKAIAEATISCTKWFRYPYLETILYYETLSETDFNIDSTDSKFNPNVYVDISGYLDEKIRVMNVYESEVDNFPFPRSEKAIRSLAYLRGAQCGAEAAESFELLRSVIKL